MSKTLKKNRGQRYKPYQYKFVDNAITDWIRATEVYARRAEKAFGKIRNYHLKHELMLSPNQKKNFILQIGIKFTDNRKTS